jgi:HD-GYP domain-containing protein (c-di-GMP phosphodiesterase class II)
MSERQLSRILALDDEETILELYEQILSPENPIYDTPGGLPTFKLTCCRQGDEGIEQVKGALATGEPYAVVFLDIHMPPGPDGVYTAGEIRKLDPDVGIVLVTGQTRINILETARTLLPMDKLLYLQKPFYPQEILQFASALSEKWRVEKEYQSILNNLEQMVADKTESLSKTNKQLSEEITQRSRMEKKITDSMIRYQAAMEGTIMAMATIVEIRDPYTAGHQQRVARLCRSIAEKIGLSPDRIEGIYLSGLIHDIGKISVPAEILSKPGQLSEVEFLLIKAHSESGYDILKGVAFPWPVAEIARQHHERLDGSGYPQGLKGENILIEARIMAVADVVEAMATHRPYRPALGIDAALEEITSKKEVFYDSQVVDACLQLYEEGRLEL